MNQKETWDLFLIAVGIIALTSGLLALLTITARKQAAKDWAKLHEMQNRAKELKTLEEVQSFHEEFLVEAKNIHNEYINPELAQLDGFLRGLYHLLKIKL